MCEVQLRVESCREQFRHNAASRATQAKSRSAPGLGAVSLLSFFRTKLGTSPRCDHRLHGVNDGPHRCRDDQDEKDRFADKVVPCLSVVLAAQMEK